MERGGLVGRSQHRGKLLGTGRMIACLRAVEDVMDETGDFANLLERHLHIAKPLRKLELRDETSHAVSGLESNVFRIRHVERHAEGLRDRPEALWRFRRHVAHRMRKRDAGRDPVRNVPAGPI